MYHVLSLKANLKSHILAVHERKKPLKCSICDARFSTRRNMKRHVASVHEKRKLYKCDICLLLNQPGVFTIKSDLTGHIETVHNDLINVMYRS